MSAFFPTDRLSPRNYAPVIWFLLACLLGWFTAAQPYPIVIFVLVGAALLFLTLLTPVAALTALLILAPMRTLIATEAQFQLPLDIGQIALGISIISYLIYRIARGLPLLRPVWTPLFLPLLVFLAVTGASAFVALSLSAWINEWLKWIQILLLVVLVLNLSGEKVWEWLLFGLVLSGVANALIGIYEFFGGSGALHLVINNRFFRAFGTFGQPNPFGGFMGLLAPLALTLTLGYGIRAWKHWRATQNISTHSLGLFIFYALASLLLLIGLLCSWSRGAWLGLGGALAAVVLALPRRAWRGIALFAIGLSIFVGLWLTGNLPASVVERLNSSTQEFFAIQDVQGVDITPDSFAVLERLAHWQAALNMATANPILGVGFGNYEAAYPTYRLLNWSEPLGHAHNYYLNILAEVGILGLLGYGKVWLLIIWMSWRARSHPDNLARLAAIGLLGSWVYLFIHSFFDNLYVNNLFLHLGLMLGVLAVLYNQAQHFTRINDDRHSTKYLTNVP